VNTDAPWPSLDEARVRILKIQTKLHQWATDSPDRRFDDLSNLVCDPAFLTVGWDRVRGQSRSTTAESMASNHAQSAERTARRPCVSCETISRRAGSSRCRCASG
jgi:hypothetical protein